MRPGTTFRPTELNLLCNKGGLGDSVARMPAIAYILRKYPHVTKVRLIVQDYFKELATALIGSSARLEVYGYSEMPALLEKYPNTPGMQVDSIHHTTLHTHLTDHAFHTLVDEQVGIEDKQYLRLHFRAQAPANYVVLTTGFTSNTREWLPGSINETAAWCKAQGLDVVFLGKEASTYWAGKREPTISTFREEVDYSVGIDLREKTSLLEAAEIMSRAVAVVGIDNGLLHLAACTNVPIVFGMTTLHPKHRLPYRKEPTYVVTPPITLGCRFCQSKMNFVYNFDLRTCYYGDYKCVESMHSSRFIKELKNVLRVRKEKLRMLSDSAPGATETDA